MAQVNIMCLSSELVFGLIDFYLFIDRYEMGIVVIGRDFQ